MEEFKGDKRSKAYRAYKAKFKEQQENESKGLGDTIAKGVFVLLMRCRQG